MKRAFLTMAVIGFAAPALFTWAYMAEHPDNFLFQTNPAKTVDLMFGSFGRAAFSADLLWVMIVLSCWLVAEGRSLSMKHAWGFIPLIFLVGMSGPSPLFLYFRERRISASPRST